MNFYFAPMEGITGYVYRNAHNHMFHSIDKYYSPFISPSPNKGLSSRERNDVLPENNAGLYLVPQILTNQADTFIRTALELQQLGYKEINLNLGCPSRTVVSKNKGSGFLSQPKELNQFLDQIFSKLDLKISIKTRIGIDSSDEFLELLKIYNQYPLEELIIHPRIQKDFYKNKPNLLTYQEAVTESKNLLCYNGDIFTQKDYKKFTDTFDQTNRIMLGRGLLANPGLVKEIQGSQIIEKQKMELFHNKIYYDYQTILSGDRDVLFKMKELWSYMIHIFSNSETYEKKIKKAQKLSDYKTVITSLFLEQEIVPDVGFFNR